MKTVIILYSGKSMKIKKKIIVGTIIVICVIIVGTIWSIKSRLSNSAAKNSAKVSTNKDKIEHNTLSQSSHKTISQPQNKSQNENRFQTKSNVGSKSQPKFQAQSESKSNVESKSQSKSQGQSQTGNVNAFQTKNVSENSSKGSTSKIQTFEGYITSEDDFSAELKEDTADMVYMRLMALSGLGITFQQDGKWVFYYFDGTFSTDNKKGADGKWSFDGTGSQLNAWRLVEQKVKSGNGKSSVPAKVTGVLNGNTETNPGPDADGKKFPVITVQSIIGK